jgi:hypothetical protein
MAASMTAVPWPPEADGLHVHGRVIAWERVRPADIKAATAGYARQAKIDRHRAGAVLVREWESWRGHAFD